MIVVPSKTGELHLKATCCRYVLRLRSAVLKEPDLTNSCTRCDVSCLNICNAGISLTVAVLSYHVAKMTYFANGLPKSIKTVQGGSLMVKMMDGEMFPLKSNVT